eukprot:SM000229S07527  [mRNA]  locus=s229:121470:126462:- [translate_table: standard]
MYGGDEVSAIVLDLGSHAIKAGYAGEDSPKAVFPSVVGVVAQSEADQNGVSHPAANGKEGSQQKGARKLYAGASALGYRRDQCEALSGPNVATHALTPTNIRAVQAVPAMKDGQVADWELVEALWNHVLRDRLLINPQEHPMLLAEPSFVAASLRERCVELMFETQSVPALFLAKNAVLTSFASARSTALVVDSGGSGTTIAAVHDGYVLQKSIGRTVIGGDVLTECMLNLMEGKGVTIRPRYSLKRKEVQPGEFEVLIAVSVHPGETLSTWSFQRLQNPTGPTCRQICLMQRAVAADMKETVCRVPDSAFEESAYTNIPTTPYELPDGQMIEVGSDRFRVAEALFNPAIVKTVPKMEDFPIEGLQGLPQMVIESINKCDADVRRDLFSSVLLSGGSTVMQQMKERLEKELLDEAPPAARVKVLASGNSIERRFSVWIGGSILASMGSFQQMWFSKSEYEEHGAHYVHRKCP